MSMMPTKEEILEGLKRENASLKRELELYRRKPLEAKAEAGERGIRHIVYRGKFSVVDGKVVFGRPDDEKLPIRAMMPIEVEQENKRYVGWWRMVIEQDDNDFTRPAPAANTGVSHYCNCETPAPRCEKCGCMIAASTEGLREAAIWIQHLLHGQSKDGSYHIDDEEWKDAIFDLDAALTRGKPDHREIKRLDDIESDHQAEAAERGKEKT